MSGNSFSGSRISGSRISGSRIFGSRIFGNRIFGNNMSGSLLQSIYNTFARRSSYQFWLLQLSFWFFLSFVSFFTLTLWYGQYSWVYLGHTQLQGLMGLILSMPLCVAIMWLWEKPLGFRIWTSILLVLTTAFIWTIARISTFILMTHESGVWADFGGWYFGSIFIFLCWASFFHGIRYYQLLQREHRIMITGEAKVQEEKLKRIQAQSAARDAKIKMLRYQLNPHFLCNTLNAINSLIESEQSQKAQRISVQLSKFLRHSLDHNPDSKITLDNELNALNLYLEIEKTRFGDRLRLDFQIDERARQACIPSLLLQPIIENSMKHVISQNENGGTINLTARVMTDKLMLELSDTGSDVKIDPGKIKGTKVRGVGLRNIHERLKVLYGDSYFIDVSAVPSGGLKTTIHIPYESLKAV